MKIAFVAVAMATLGFGPLSAQAREINLDPLQNMNIRVSGKQDDDILIPPGDEVSVRVLRDTFDGGCEASESNGGMVWDISVVLGRSTPSENCVVRITEDGQSAVIDFYGSPN